MESEQDAARQADLGAIADVTYRKPPLSETSLGVEFAPISGWNVHPFGLYHTYMRDRYPRFETSAPIAVSASGTQEFSIAFGSTIPKIRAFFTDEARARLLQIQDDLFYANWQKMQGEEAYPRYRELRRSFVEEWNGYRGFLAANGLSIGQIFKYQLTYINVFQPSADPEKLLDIEDAYVGWRSLDGPFASSRTNVSFSIVHQIENIELLYVLQPAVRLSDGQRVFQFTLTTSTRKVDPSGKTLRIK